MDEQLSEAEGKDLLKLARYALAASQGSLGFFPKITKTLGLKSKRGVFISLWNGNELRGCVGIVNPEKPLEEAVMEITLKSILQDTRFSKIPKEEIPKLRLEVTVLKTPWCSCPEEIEIGVHGLLIMDGDAVGILLPHVPVDQKWDVPTFLKETCLHGGMSPNAWKTRATLAVFTVQSFRE